MYNITVCLDLHIAKNIFFWFVSETKKTNTTESYDKSTKRNYPNKSLSINQNQCRARHYKFRFLLSPEISNVADA